VIGWDAPGPYRVVFSTRNGGVSDGPFSSLNLGGKQGDDMTRVYENRRRACAEIGADVDRLSMTFQVHSPHVHRAVAGVRGEKHGDGLWTDEPGVPILALTADCVPIALVRTDGAPAAAVLHAGRIGLLDGVAENGIRLLGGKIAAAIGPSAGPCCYEVGEEVAAPYRRRFGSGIMRGRHLNLWDATEHVLRAAGVKHVERVDLCTICNPKLFFSERRTGKPRGTQGVLAVVA
jgi:YfiH family protein